MLLNEDGTFEGATGRLLRQPVLVPLSRLLGNLLLLNADEHLGEQEAPKLLPGHLVLAHPKSSVQSQLAEPAEVEAVPVIDTVSEVFRNFLKNFR